MIDLASMKPEDRAIAIAYLGCVEEPASKPKPRGASEPEKEFMEQAKAAQAMGLLIDAQPQPKPAFELDGSTRYQPDFWLLTPWGESVLVETKGRRMTSESLTRMKLRQCSERYPENIWWLARWHPKLPWRVQEVAGGVVRRKPISVEWLNG
jgi:hypothetical protein